MGPDVKWTDEKPDGEITLFVYEGADACFTLYEDEGINYNYEKGEFSRIPFTYDNAKSILTIGEREGQFSGMPLERKFNIIKVSKDSPAGFSRSSSPSVALTYTGSPFSLHI